MERLEQLKSKINKLRALYEELGIDEIAYCWPDNREGNNASTSISEEDITAIEAELGARLPAEYREFLLFVGDINVGPGNRFYRLKESLRENSHCEFPLKEPRLGQMSVEVQQKSSDQRWELFDTQLKEWSFVPKDHGVLERCDYGCDIKAVLIIRGFYEGKIWLQNGDVAYYGPFGAAEELHDLSGAIESELSNSPKDFSFMEWYEHWINCRLKELESERGDESATSD
jgi:hypothetical protein